VMVTGTQLLSRTWMGLSTSAMQQAVVSSCHCSCHCSNMGTGQTACFSICIRKCSSCSSSAAGWLGYEGRLLAATFLRLSVQITVRRGSMLLCLAATDCGGSP
jgi:hypothetical protein